MPQPTNWQLKPGDDCGPYEIVSRLGEGGYGIVYKAVDINTGEVVALKVVITRFVEDKLATERLLREAKALRQTNHVNVVGYRAAGLLSNGEGFWLAMELIRGETLRALLSVGQVPARRVLEIGSQVCAGLSALHAEPEPLVHRDIKPRNLMVTGDGTVKVIDLGIVRTREGAGTTTQVGSQMYCAPDYLRHSPTELRDLTDNRWDLFSLGIVLWEALAGHHPFLPHGTKDISLGGLLGKYYRGGGVPRLCVKGLPDSVCDVIAKAVVLNPNERWQTAAEFAAALDECTRQYLPKPQLGAATSPIKLSPSSSGTRPLNAAELARFREEQNVASVNTAPIVPAAVTPEKRTAPLDVMRAAAALLDDPSAEEPPRPVAPPAEAARPQTKASRPQGLSIALPVQTTAEETKCPPLWKRTISQRHYDISIAALVTLGAVAALAILMRLLGVV